MKKWLLIFSMLLFFSSMLVANASNSPPGDLQISQTEVLSDFVVVPDQFDFMLVDKQVQIFLVVEEAPFIGPGLIIQGHSNLAADLSFYRKTFTLVIHYSQTGYSIWN